MPADGARPRSAAARRARDGDGRARLARPARPARGAHRRHRSTTCGRPGSPAPRTCRCSTPGPPPGTLRRVVAAAGDWQLPQAVRDAMRAWRFDEATALLDDARTSSTARRDRDGRRGGRADAPTTLRTAFESHDGFDDTAARGRGRLTRSSATPPPRHRVPNQSDPLVRLGLSGRARRGSRPAPEPRADRYSDLDRVGHGGDLDRPSRPQPGAAGTPAGQRPSASTVYVLVAVISGDPRPSPGFAASSSTSIWQGDHG